MCPKFVAEIQLLGLAWIQTQAGDPYPLLALQSNTLLSFSLRNIFLSTDKHRRKAARPAPSEIAPRAADWHLDNGNTRSVLCVYELLRQCFPKMRISEMRKMSSRPRSILTQLGRGAARAQTPRKSKKPRTSLLLHTYDKHSSTTTAKSLLF